MNWNERQNLEFQTILSRMYYHYLDKTVTKEELKDIVKNLKSMYEESGIKWNKLNKEFQKSIEKL